jgi:hypothetical protein
VIRKTYSKFGKLVNEHYPLDSEGKTKGKCNTSGFILFYLVSSSLALQVVLWIRNVLSLSKPTSLGSCHLLCIFEVIG